MNKRFYQRLISLCLIVSLIVISSPIQIAEAASLTSMSDTMTRLKAATLSDHTILFTTPTGMATGTIVIDFNTAGFDDGTVDDTDIDLSYDVTDGSGNDQTLAATAGVDIWGAVFAANVLTLTYPTSGASQAITAGWIVKVEIGTVAAGASNAQMTNPSAGNDKVISITTKDAAAATVDSGSFGVSIIAEDQVTITATVDPTVSFEITDATVALGTLSASAVATSTAEMTAATNATGGYSITVSGATLTNAASDTIDKIAGDSHVASDPGLEQFGLKISKSGNTGVAVDPYNDATQYAYTADAVGTADECANSASDPSATTTFTMEYMANITTTTEAGSYSATHTYICTGTF